MKGFSLLELVLILAIAVTLAAIAGPRYGNALANYGADEIARIKGHRSDSIQDILGCNYGEEVVHRNNMVIL